MTTNILCTILVCLVTNVSEQIHTPQPNYLQTLDLNSQHWFTRQPYESAKPYKLVTTEIYDQRLLILEAEGLHFTNVLKSTLISRAVDYFNQETLPPPEPRWIKREDLSRVQTNFDMKPSGLYVFTNAYLPYEKQYQLSPNPPEQIK